MAGETSSALAVYLVDDHADFRETALWWIESLGHQVRAFEHPRALLAELESKPLPSNGCFVLDVRLPDMSGLQLHDELLQRGIKAPTIYMTGHGDIPLAVEAMRKGALTFLEKPFQERALEKALILAVEQLNAPPPPSQAADGAAAGGQAPLTADEQAARGLFESRYSNLSQRQRQVLERVVEGRLNKSIAEELQISVKTVELHRARLMQKLQAESLVHLITMVVRREVVPPR